MATRKPVPKTTAAAKTRAGTEPSARTSKRSPAETAKLAAAKPAAPAAKAEVAASAASAKTKHKLVRDSFTIPKHEYAALGDLKQRAARLARPVKKSEILRAGIAALSAMTDQPFLSALDAVPSLKTGRPKQA